MDNNFVKLENTLGMFESCFLKLFFVLKITENTKNLFGSHLLYFKNTKKNTKLTYITSNLENTKRVFSMSSTIFKNQNQTSPMFIFLHLFILHIMLLQYSIFLKLITF